MNLPCKALQVPVRTALVFPDNPDETLSGCHQLFKHPRALPGCRHSLVLPDPHTVRLFEKYTVCQIVDCPGIWRIGRKSEFCLQSLSKQIAHRILAMYDKYLLRLFLKCLNPAQQPFPIRVTADAGQPAYHRTASHALHPPEVPAPVSRVPDSPQRGSSIPFSRGYASDDA